MLNDHTFLIDFHWMLPVVAPTCKIDIRLCQSCNPNFRSRMQDTPYCSLPSLGGSASYFTVQIHLLIASGASFSARRSGVCLLFCWECLCRPVPHTWFSARGKFYASAPGGIAICIHWRYGLLIHCEINHYKICLAGRQQWRSISLGDGWSSAFKSCRSVFLQVRLFNNKQSRDKEWQGVTRSPGVTLMAKEAGYRYLFIENVVLGNKLFDAEDTDPYDVYYSTRDPTTQDGCWGELTPSEQGEIA